MWPRLLIIQLTTMLLAARLVLGLAARYTPTPHGVLVSVGANQVELAVQGQTAFRVSVSKYGAPVQLESAFLETPASYAPFTITSQGDLVGIKAAFGSVAIDSKAAFTLADGNGTVLTTSTLFPPSSFSNKKAPKDTCAQVQNSTDVTNPQRSPKYPDGLSGQTLQSCCTICNNDPDCNIFVWADNTHPDPSGKNCWMLSAVDSFIPKAGRSSGGSIPPPPGSVVLQLGVHDGNTKFYGAGGGYSTVTSITATSSNPHVSNTEFTVPHYWSNDGYAALGVTASQYDPKALNAYQATWSASQTVTWTFSGNQSDLYLMPAASMLDGQRVYWDLTGRPRVLPRYGHGFLASRWGWTDRAYIESMLTQFRSGSFPIDAWISDFEPDYSLPDSGSPTFVDFEYNNITFPQPLDQLKIVDCWQGWLIKGQGRNLNYSISDVRDWYAAQIAHFSPDGVDFWWNDEGETLYYTFYWWNVAQVASLAAFDPKKRFFTINRAFTPGMQRLGLVVWTGDITVSWDSMRHQPAYAAAWTLAGAPYITCDIGGFNGPDDAPDLLARWYQSGAFLPVMRVHSDISDKPHFPFLYGDAAGHAMQNALNLRYQLLPYLYSVAHGAYRDGAPIIRPLAMHYPSDPAVQTIIDQWFFGPSLMAAPVMTSSDGSTTDTSRGVYLPQGLWYQLRYGTSALVASTITGPLQTTLNNIELDQILFFAPAGAIVPMAPVVQYSDALPGGPLQVAVFPGADGTFIMTEDDGETSAYEQGVLRATTFTWNDQQRSLSWTVAGTFSDEHTFIQVVASVYFVGATKVSTVQALGNGGVINF